MVCGDALQIANLRFEGRHPEVIKALISSFENIEKRRNLKNANEERLKLGKVLSQYCNPK